MATCKPAKSNRDTPTSIAARRALAVEGMVTRQGFADGVVLGGLDMSISKVPRNKCGFEKPVQMEDPSCDNIWGDQSDVAEGEGGAGLAHDLLIIASKNSPDKR